MTTIRARTIAVCVSASVLVLVALAWAGKPFPLPGTHSEVAQSSEILSSREMPGACGEGQDVIVARLLYKGVRYNFMYAPASDIGMFIEFAQAEPGGGERALRAVYVWFFHGQEDVITVDRALPFTDLFPAERESPCAVLYPPKA